MASSKMSSLQRWYMNSHSEVVPLLYCYCCHIHGGSTHIQAAVLHAMIHAKHQARKRAPRAVCTVFLLWSSRYVREEGRPVVLDLL